MMAFIVLVVLSFPVGALLGVRWITQNPEKVGLWMGRMDSAAKEFRKQVNNR